ncbi:protein of unknown function [Vibrio tapetis subsp. tapetis]|uniref:Uncharacterized protein n=1 Tax=Vibrio tapetis subsp. tapetis TaxID=1671868 RepID=A0A2N8Z886_9VIBR|nr:protein of unknown function [Vibrio tapetis subsp. tapetis]
MHITKQILLNSSAEHPIIGVSQAKISRFLTIQLYAVAKK